MKEEFDYKEVPQSYVHCLNAVCKKSDSCLRFKVGQAIPDEVSVFKIVNPSPVNKSESECRYFEPIKKLRYALGISHLYDDLPHTKYNRIKKAIHRYLEHNRYYRIYNKEYLITPEQQEFIRDLFRKEGIEKEPVFDEYIERYNFSVQVSPHH
ncbi:hypothetical protein M2138_000551 [Dysgonomonadaceae bacterium PH5-43]|nr:hypothetical protein [Dysgonomonadaceae bacterium PH5-43]